jgi:hypothetical protein
MSETGLVEFPPTAKIENDRPLQGLSDCHCHAAEITWHSDARFQRTSNPRSLKYARNTAFKSIPLIDIAF